MRQKFDLSAVVRLMAGDFTASWEGRVARMDANIDPQTRTAGVIVVVDGPYEKILPGVRPPLVRNMYCEVEIKGRLQPDTVVIPKSAYHEGIVYLMDSDKRLRKRQVEIQFSQTNFYALSAGLNPGEWVIVSDLVPAIEGMLLQPVEDPDLEKGLTAEATGTTSVK
jgi:multidrug efflux pump subunit AcrA (membrane-fusion protein)